MTEVILDTHAIVDLLKIYNTHDRLKQVAQKLSQKYHSVATPALYSEYKAVIKPFEHFPALLSVFQTILKGKFKPDVEPIKNPTHKIKQTLEQLRKHGANKGDLNLVSAAIKLSRQHPQVIIISNDPCFHTTAALKQYNIQAQYVDEFMEQLS